MTSQNKIILLTLLSQSFICIGMDKSALELALQDIRSFGINAEATCQTSAQRANSLLEQKHIQEENLQLQYIRSFGINAQATSQASAQRTNSLLEQKYIQEQKLQLQSTPKQNTLNQNAIIISQVKRFKEPIQQKETIIDLTTIFPEDMRKLADVKKVNFAANFKKDINPELHYLASALDANINKNHSLLEKCYFLAAIGASDKTKLSFNDLLHALDANNKDDILVGLGTLDSPLELENENDYTKYIAAYVRTRDQMISTMNNKNITSSSHNTNASSSTTENNCIDLSQIQKTNPQPNSNIPNSHVKITVKGSTAKTVTAKPKPAAKKDAATLKYYHIPYTEHESDFLLLLTTLDYKNFTSYTNTYLDQRRDMLKNYHTQKSTLEKLEANILATLRENTLKEIQKNNSFKPDREERYNLLTHLLTHLNSDNYISYTQTCINQAKNNSCTQKSSLQAKDVKTQTAQKQQAIQLADEPDNCNKCCEYVGIAASWAAISLAITKTISSIF